MDVSLLCSVAALTVRRSKARRGVHVIGNTAGSRSTAKWRLSHRVKQWVYPCFPVAEPPFREVDPPLCKWLPR